MSKLLDIVYELRDTNSRKEKETILLKYSNDYDFRYLLRITYDVSYVFSFKRFPKLNEEDFKNELSTMELLKYFVREFITDDKSDILNRFTNTMLLGSYEDYELIKLVFNKDLRAGIDIKTIHKCMPDLLFILGYMGAVPYSSKRVEKLIATSNVLVAQEKMDGEYLNLIVAGDIVKAYARSNKPMHVSKILLNQIPLRNSDRIYNGELIMSGYDRYTSNGLISRLSTYYKYVEKEHKLTKKALETMLEIAGLNTLEELEETVRYVIWDYIDKDKVYIDRLRELVNDPILKCPQVTLVDTTIITKVNMPKIEHPKIRIKHLVNVNDIVAYTKSIFKDVLSNKGEGIVLKDGYGLWVSGKPVYQVKYKTVIECELKVIGFNQGTVGKKFEHGLASFIAISSDNKLTAEPGGIEEDMRDSIWQDRDDWLNSIITVKSNGLSRDRLGNFSLLHPVFIKRRDDKNIADSLGDIINIQNGKL